MNPKERSTVRAWEDPDDAPDLSQPEWAEKFSKVPIKRGRLPKAVRKISTTIRLDAG